MKRSPKSPAGARALGALARVGVLSVVVAGTVATAAGAKTTLPVPSKAKPVPIDTVSVEKKITQIARDKAKGLGITVGKATCPKGVAADKPVFSFQCTIPYEGLQAPYVVTLDIATAAYDIEPGQAILATKLLTKFVRENLDGDAALVAKATIDCGKGKVVLRPAGATIDCTVRSPKGGVIVVLKAEDVMGRVTIAGNKPLK